MFIEATPYPDSRKTRSEPVNTLVQLGALRLYIYRNECIGFKNGSDPAIVCHSTRHWFPIPPRFLNTIDGGTPIAVRARLDRGSFERELNRITLIIYQSVPTNEPMVSRTLPSSDIP